MKAKIIKEEQDQPIVKKKVYTPPTVTVYGKLTDLTAGGTGMSAEGDMVTDTTRRPGS